MPEAVACANCGALNLAGQRFCGACGNALEEAGSSDAVSEGSAASAVVDERPAETRRGDERRLVTVLFADIAGFTSMSEKLDFEEVRDIADRCAEIMGEEARRFDGTVLNVMGDAVMAVFGAPLAHDDDAERAVRAALAMVDAIPRKTSPEHSLALHIGINTGEVMSGMLGPSGRRDYTVMGDSVNTGARLEAAAVRGEVLVGRDTYLATRHAIRYEPHEPVSAKGKEEKVEAWLAIEPLTERGERSAITAPLVGREREMDILQGLWRSTVEGSRAHMAALIAPPGLGKTRLGREFASAVAAEGALVLVGRSLPYGESTGYRGFAEQVRAAAEITAEMSPANATEALAHHVSELFAADEGELTANLAVMLGLGGDGIGPEKNVLFFAARRWLAAQASRQPVLMVFEDVHWADATLVELINSLASRAGEVPAMILCLARPELLETHPEWAAGQLSYSAISLEPLSAEASQRLTGALLGDVPPDVIDRLVTASGGNPLFVEELSATITEQDGAQAGRLPTTVTAILGARLDLLDEDERELVLNAAVVGDVFWRGALVTLGGGGEVDAALEKLEGRGLFRHEDASTIAGETQLRFKHALIREVAYGRLPKRARRERHAVVAAYLEGTLGAQAEEMASLLAHHWAEAGDVDSAVRYYTIAGDRAANAWAKAEAIDSFSRALALLGDRADAEGAPQLLARRGRAYSGAGDFVHAAADLEAALPALTGVERVQALLEMGRVAFTAVDADAIVKYAALASEAALEEGDKVTGAAALALRAHASLMSGDAPLDEAIETTTKAIESWPAESRDNDRDYADGLSTLSLVHYWRGDYEQALTYGREAVERGLALQALTTGAQGTAHMAISLVGLGRHPEAIEWFEKSVAIGLDWEAVPRFSSRSMNMWAGALQELMDWKAARELSLRGLEMGRQAKFPPAIYSAGIDLLLLDISEGRLTEAAAALPDMWTAAHETKGFHHHLFEMRVGDANSLLALAMGDAAEGVAQASQAMSNATKLSRRKYVTRTGSNLARCLLATGRAAEAAPTAQESLTVATALGHPQSIWRAADILSRANEAMGKDNDAAAAATLASDEVSRFGRTLDAQRAGIFFGAEEVAEILARAGSQPPV